MDLGAGIAIASATFFLFLLLTKSKNFSDLKRVKTFDKKTIFISSNLAWLLLLPGTYWYYWFRLGRGDYPPFADGIAIALFSLIPITLFLFIPLNIFLWLTTKNTNLPTQLLIKAENYNKSALFWEIFFGFWLLISILCFFAFVIDGNHFAVPISLFFVYILLSLRAGKISKYRND